MASGIGHVAFSPGIYLEPPQPIAFRFAAVVGTVVAASYLARTPWWIRRWRFVATVSCAAVMGIATIMASPMPRIDVWLVVFVLLDTD